MAEIVNSDTVRHNAQVTSKTIRVLGEQAKTTGDELFRHAQDVADAIEAASERVAVSIEEYLRHCELTTLSVADQRDVLADLPARTLDIPASREDDIDTALKGIDFSAEVELINTNTRGTGS